MPPEDSTIEIETVQHPTLGPLKFPNDMPYEQRNQLIENLEAEQKALTKAGTQASNMQGLTIDGPSQPRKGRGEGDSAGIGERILQRHPGSDAPGTLQLPRYYGAPPPNQLQADDSNLNALQPARVRYLLGLSNPRRESPSVPSGAQSSEPFSAPRKLDFTNDTSFNQINRSIDSGSGVDRLLPNANSRNKDSQNFFDNPANDISRRLSPSPARRNDEWRNAGGPFSPRQSSPEQDSRPELAVGVQSSETSSIQGNRYVGALDVNNLMGSSLTDSQAQKTSKTIKTGALPAGQIQGHTATSPTNENGQQPSTIWMVDRDGIPRRVPVGQYQSLLKQNYKLAVPVVGPLGDSHYVSLDQLKDFTSYGYKPGRRVQLDATHGSKEIIVPLEGAEKNVPKGAKLLPMSPQEALLTSKANWYGTVQNSGIPEVGLKPTPWQPGDTQNAQVMVSGASKANVEKYLPHVINGLKWKFGDSWHDYLPAALRTISAESSDFAPRTQGNGNPNDMRRGHGWVQLSERFNFERMNKELGLAGTKDDIVKNPAKANRPDIAGKILAQYIYDHREEKDIAGKNGQRFHHYGLQPLVEANKGEIKPDPQEALAAYIKLLKTDYSKWKENTESYVEELRKRLEKDPQLTTITKTLLNNIYVQDRLAVNTRHFQNTPFEGLPNGLERYLPAAAFERKHQKIVKAAQDPKSNITLKDAADQWVEGVEEFGDKNYAKTLTKKLGLPEGTDLSKIKLSQLPPEMRNEMVLAERDYTQQVVHSLERLASQPKNHTANHHSKKH